MERSNGQFPQSTGMKRRGKSATAIVKQMFGLPVNTHRNVLVNLLTKEIEEFSNGRISTQAR